MSKRVSQSFRLSFIALGLLVWMNGASALASAHQEACSDTVEAAWKRSDSIYWVTEGASEDGFVWLKNGIPATSLKRPDEVVEGCAFIAFVDHNGKQFQPCVLWAHGVELPSAAILISRALSDGENCAEECSNELGFRISVVSGHVTAAGWAGPPYDGQELDAMRLAALKAERERFPDLDFRLDARNMPQCFRLTASRLRALLQSEPRSVPDLSR